MTFPTLFLFQSFHSLPLLSPPAPNQQPFPLSVPLPTPGSWMQAQFKKAQQLSDNDIDFTLVTLPSIHTPHLLWKAPSYKSLSTSEVPISLMLLHLVSLRTLSLVLITSSTHTEAFGMPSIYCMYLYTLSLSLSVLQQYLHLHQSQLWFPLVLPLLHASHLLHFWTQILHNFWLVGMMGVSMCPGHPGLPY